MLGLSFLGKAKEIMVTHKVDRTPIHTKMYEDISLRLEVISEIIDELIMLYPEERNKVKIEERIEQKLMIRKLSGD
jgi:hypothetical protein